MAGLVAGLMLTAMASAQPLSGAIDSALSTSSPLTLPTSGTITATQIGDGIWWRPELDETSITLMLDNLQAWDIKNLYVDVFRSGETLYPSSVLPQRADASSRDWLAHIIAQAHDRNIRVHAWVQVLCWQEPDEDELASHSLLYTNPGWVDVNDDGVAFDGKTLARYLNPGVPEVRSILLQLADEICTRYQIDGFNMDAIQYNYRTDTGYNPAMVREFYDQTGIDATDLQRNLDSESDWMAWTTFREDQLTSLVQLLAAKCRRAAETRNSRILVSANVQPGYQDSRGMNRRYQNWQQWVDEQIIDFTLPECFSPDLPGLEKQLWNARSIHMGSKVACVPALLLDNKAGDSAHPSLKDQKRLLHNTGFQHCNIMDYQGYVLEIKTPADDDTDNKNSFWDFLRSKHDKD